MQQISHALNQLNTAIFAKDLSHRFIYCNEKFANECGEDSPAALYGKTDGDVIWKEYEDLYRISDEKSFEGESVCNLLEPKRHPSDAQITVLVNKNPLLNSDGEIIGLVGSYVDVTGLGPLKQHHHTQTPAEKGFDLGAYFSHETLSNREFQVLKKLLLGNTAKQIASSLCISQKTAESHIARIKVKMQCTTRGDITFHAVVSGLYYRLLGILDS